MPRRMRRRRRRKRQSTRAFGAAVRSVLNSQSETKWVDRSIEAFPLTATAGTQSSIFQIAVGNGFSERIGNRIRVVAIHIDVLIDNLSANPYNLRQVLYKRKGPYNVAIPVVTNVAEYIDPDVFVTKKDQLNNLLPLGAGPRSTVRFTYHKRWPAGSGGQLVEYFGNGATQATSGFWQLWTATSNVTAADLSMHYRYRVFFKDV